MADSLELHLNIQKALEKDLEKSNEHLNKINKSTDRLADSFNNIPKQVEKTNGLLSKMGSTLLGIFAKGAGMLSLAGIVEDTLNIDKNLSRLAARTSKAGENVGIIKDATFSIARNTGLSAENAAELVSQLKGFKIADNDLKSLGTSVTNFSKATGVSSETVAQLSGNMVRWGKMSVQQTETVLASMGQAQKVFNLTEGELAAMGDSIQLNTKRLRLMGKSGLEIQAMQKGVVKLAGAFAAIGIEAGKSNQMITDLLDPSKIEDNALMYAKLGVSISDVMQGTVDVAGLAPKFKQLGQEIKGGGMAGVALAKQLNLSVEEAKQLADIDTSKFEEAMRKTGNDAGKALKLLNENGKGAGEIIGDTWENIRTTLIETLSTAMPLIKVLAVKFKEIVDWLSKGASDLLKNFKVEEMFTGFSKLVKGIPAKLILAIGAGLLALKFLLPKIFAQKANYTAITDGIRDAYSIGAREGLQMGVEKASMSKDLSTSRSGASDDKTRRIQMSKGYSRRQGAADSLDSTAQTNMFGFMKNMVKATAEWNRELAAASTPVSKLVTWTERLEKGTRDNAMKSLESAKIQQQNATKEVEDAKTRIEYLKRIQKQEFDKGMEVDRQSGTYKKITRELEKQEKIRDDQIALTKINEAIEARSIKYYEGLSQVERGIAQEKLTSIKEVEQANIVELKNRMEAARISTELLSVEKNALDVEAKKILNGREVEKLDIKELDAYREIERRLKDNLAVTNSNIESQRLTNDELTKTETNLIDIVNELEKVSNSGKTAIDIAPDLTSFPRKLENGAKGFAKNIRGAVQVFGDKVADSARGFKEVMKNVFNVKNLVTAAKDGAGGIGKLMAGGLGIGALVSILTRSKPVQEMIAKISAKLAPIMVKLSSALEPLIDPIIMMVEILLPPVIKVLGGLLKAITWLLKPISWLAEKLTGNKDNALSGLINGLDDVADTLLKFDMTPLAEATKDGTEATEALAEEMKNSNEVDPTLTTYNVGAGGNVRLAPPPNVNAKPTVVQTDKESKEIAKRTADATEASAQALVNLVAKDAKNQRAPTVQFSSDFNVARAGGR